jgi:5-formyltetrahydrofolate cyclo-ligase
MILEKNNIRKTILNKRALLSEAEVEENSRKIIESIYKTDEFISASCIMCYVDFKKEVKTEDFIKLCLSMGKRVAVPVIIKDSVNFKTIIASEIYSFGNDMERNSFGILEPKKEALREVDPSQIDLMIVPGLAFDIYKNRLGFGAGFYDKFLENTKKDCYKLAVAYEMQIIEKVPTEEHDKVMDSIITEKRIIL